MSYLVNIANSLTYTRFVVLANMINDTIIDDNTKVVPFCRIKGDKCCIAVLYNCDTDKEYKAMYEKYNNFFKEYSQNNSVKVTIAHIFLSSQYSEVSEFIDEPVSGNDLVNFYGVKWLANTCSKMLETREQEILDSFELKKYVCRGLLSKSKKNSIEVSRLVKKAADVNEKPIVTYGLLIICAIFFAISSANHNFLDYLSLNGLTVFNGYQPYTILTHMFLHNDLLHFVGNMGALYVLGISVESKVPHYKFAIIYLLSGIVAGLLSAYIQPFVFSVGASGAIYGLLGAIVYFTKKNDCYMGMFDFKCSLLYAIFSFVCLFGFPNVNNYAHLFGFFAGIILGFVLRIDK